MVAQATGWVVLKFGGTSVSRRNRWDTIGRLASKRLKDDGRRVLVVVSALSGVTNELQAIAYAAPGQDDGIAARFAGLVERHRAFCAELRDHGMTRHFTAVDVGTSVLAEHIEHGVRIGNAKQ